MYLGVLALVKEPRDANTKVRNQRLAIKIENQR